MEETTRRKITVTSSLDEIATDQLGIGCFFGWGGTLPAPTLLNQAFVQKFKDGVNGFSSMHLIFLFHAKILFIVAICDTS
jgi:hypothetical protein